MWSMTSNWFFMPVLFHSVASCVQVPEGAEEAENSPGRIFQPRYRACFLAECWLRGLFQAAEISIGVFCSCRRRDQVL